MTNPSDRPPTVPEQPQGHPWPPTHNLITGQPIQPPKKSRRRLWLILAAAGALVIVIAVTVAITLAMQSGTKTRPAAQTAWDREQAQLDPTPETTTEAPAATPTPTVSDFTLKPKITSKECFGSAGCLLTLKVNAEYSGPVLSEDDTWQITYEIRGIEDGPLIGSFEMSGTQYQVQEENVDTKSTKSKVTIKVTSVEKVGL